MNIVNLLYNVVINLIDFTILHRFLRYFSVNSRSPGFLNKFLLVLCTFILSLINLYEIPNMNLAAVCILIYLYSITFRYSFLYHVILPMLYIGMMFVTEPIGLLLIRSLEGYVSPLVAYNISVLLCELIRLLISHVICQRWRAHLPVLSFHLCLLMFMIPVSSIVAGCLAIYIARINETPVGNRLCLAVILIILFSNALTFTVFHRLGILTSESQKNILLLHEARAKEEYYLEVERNSRNIQEIKHDLKNRLLGAMAEDSASLVKEVESILGDLERNEKRVYTSNVVFNTILNSKLNSVCGQLQIKTEISVFIPQKMNLEYSDVGILLGNLLDNAVEACRRSELPDRWINVAINYRSQILVIRISNSKDRQSKILNKSSKRDTFNHGFGIGSVKRVAEKYNGSTEFVDNGDWFESSAILYGIQSDIE